MVKAGGLLVVGTIIAALINLLMRLWRADRNEYDANREAVPTWGALFTGRVNTRVGGVRNFRLRAGLAVDTNTNTWVEQGRLSEEALDSVLRSPRRTS